MPAAARWRPRDLLLFGTSETLVLRVPAAVMAENGIDGFGPVVSVLRGARHRMLLIAAVVVVVARLRSGIGRGSRRRRWSGNRRRIGTGGWCHVDRDRRQRTE